MLTKLNRQELQAVMAHELSHIRHQDIKLTLMASVLTNLILIVVDILFYSLIFGRERKGNNGLIMVVILLRYFMPIITIIMLLYLSRTREFMADSGCVQLTRDNQALGDALIKIHQDYLNNQPAYYQAYGQTKHEEVRRAAYLYDPVQAGVLPQKSIAGLFSTHPSLEARLKAIGYRLPNAME